jgi:hypothetical protein
VVNYIHNKCYEDNFVLENRNRSLPELAEGVESLLDNCMATDLKASQGIGTDNMTAMVVEFRGPKREQHKSF